MIKVLRVTAIKHAILLLTTAIFLASCSNSMTEINDLTNKRQSQDDRGIDVTVIYSKNGIVQARLFTHELIRNETAAPPYTDMKNGLKVEFFNDSAVVKNTLTAKNARWYINEGDIIIRDSVVVVNDKGDKLETQELIWKSSTKKFFTEKPVSIATPTHIIFGTGMQADEDFSHYHIIKPTGAVQVNKKEVPGN